LGDLFQDLAERVHGHLERRAGRGGLGIRPECLDQMSSRGRTPTVADQVLEERTRLARPPSIYRSAADAELERAEARDSVRKRAVGGWVALGRDLVDQHLYDACKLAIETIEAIVEGIARIADRAAGRTRPGLRTAARIGRSRSDFTKHRCHALHPLEAPP